MKKLYVPRFKQRTSSFGQPLRVCTSDKCMSYITDADNLRRIKHDCRKKSRSLQRIKSFGCESKACKRCGCDRSEHMIITFDSAFVETFELDDSRQLKLTGSEDEATKIASHVQTLEETVTLLQDDQTKITSTMATFSNFLKTNSVAPYNNEIEDHLRLALRIAHDAALPGTVERLENVRREYERECEKLEKGSNESRSKADAISAKYIETLIDRLYALKTVGEMIKECMQVAEAAEMNDSKLNEVVSDLSEHKVLSKRHLKLRSNTVTI